MSEIKELFDQIDDVHNEFEFLTEQGEMDDQQVEEFGKRRFQLEEQVRRQIIKLDKTNPDLAEKMARDFVHRSTQRLDYIAYTLGNNAETEEIVNNTKHAMRAWLKRRWGSGER